MTATSAMRRRIAGEARQHAPQHPADGGQREQKNRLLREAEGAEPQPRRRRREQEPPPKIFQSGARRLPTSTRTISAPQMDSAGTEAHQEHGLVGSTLASRPANRPTPKAPVE